MRRAIVRELTTRTQYPSVSILMPTHPGHPDNQQDPIRLKNLLEEARHRLTEEVGKRPSWPLMERLEAMSEEIDWRQNQQGIALYASDDFAAWYRLPFPVEPRVTVDATFETRDIVYALHRMPRYRVLVLAEQPTRLFEGQGEDLEEVRNGQFPIAYTGAPGTTRTPDAPQMRSSNVREAHLLGFFKEVDEALTEVARNDRLPLVVAGTGRSITTFEEVSNNTDDIAVRVEGSYDNSPASAIGQLVWPRFQEWLAEQRQLAVREVEDAFGARRLASGLDEAWQTAKAGQGLQLVVEENYRQPAIVHREGWELELVSEEDAGTGAAHLDDAVDELIEMVLDKGGEVVFVEDGALANYGRVALILRY